MITKTGQFLRNLLGTPLFCSQPDSSVTLLILYVTVNFLFCDNLRTFSWNAVSRDSFYEPFK